MWGRDAGVVDFLAQKEGGKPSSCRAFGGACALQLLVLRSFGFGLVAMLVLALGTPSAAARAKLSPRLEIELYSGIVKCVAFFADRDLAVFAGMKKLKPVTKKTSKDVGVFGLPSGKLAVRAKRVDFGGPSCKIFATGYFDDNSKRDEIDTALVYHFDGKRRINIGGVKFRAKTKFFNKVDKSRLVACIGGIERGLIGERNFINGKGSVGFITPLRGDIPC